MVDWWNSAYSIRRNLKFSPAVDLQIQEGYPLTAIFKYANLVSSNKVRPDFEDIEVVFWDPDLEENVLIPRLVSTSGEDIHVKFNSVTNIEEPELGYYIYMANPSLSNGQDRGLYEPADYVIDTSTNSGVGLSFTKPTEDWVDGLSQTSNAKATFSFFGVNARVIVQKGPDRGLLEVRVDQSTPIIIDTYSSTYTDQVVFTTSGLDLGRHSIRMRVLGDKNESSNGTQIKIVKVQYSKYVLATDLGEELNPVLSTRRIFVGP